MTMKSAVLVATMIVGSAISMGYASPAKAGDLTNARLACYVDTYAYDQLSNDYCASAWTPSTAKNPTTAHFEVTGLAPGTYSFSWLNLETGGSQACGNSSHCNKSIATETRGDGEASLQVTITDTTTGASKSVSAVAEYLDAWN